MNRQAFELHILRTHKQTQPWDLLERSRTNPDEYLDLYVEYEWRGWKAAMLQRR